MPKTTQPGLNINENTHSAVTSPLTEPLSPLQQKIHEMKTERNLMGLSLEKTHSIGDSLSTFKLSKAKTRKDIVTIVEKSNENCVTYSVLTD